VIGSGGGQLVFGSASGTTINSGGSETTYGTTTSATVSGGTERDYGIAAGITINSGGLVQVFAGGTLSAATLNGGTVEILNGAIVSSALVAFGSGGTLKLDNSQNFGGTISGFNSTLPDQIDLVDIGFTGQSTLGYTDSGGASGTLTVGDGTHTANLLLLGGYVTANFTAQSDGHGGTLITDPPVITTPHS
jgi:autotransporter passenger strand-loop-strand repeat protein